MASYYSSKKKHICPFSNILNRDSGIILIVTLWVMVILSMLSVGIGRQANLEINLTKHLLGKIRANSIAWSGLIYAMEQIYLDSMDDISKGSDTLLYCGIRMNIERSAVDLFKERSFYLHGKIKNRVRHSTIVFYIHHC